MIGAILCTDMSNHFAMTQEFRKHDAEVGGGGLMAMDTKNDEIQSLQGRPTFDKLSLILDT